MDSRPFYELDDEELIIAEATDAALSNTQIRALPQTTERAEPGLMLCASIDAGTYERLVKLSEQTTKFTILDHAQIMNACACCVDRQGADLFGLLALFRHESGLLQLDRIAPGDAPRSLSGLRPESVIELLTRSTPSDRNPPPQEPARRLSSSEILALAPLAEETNRFLVARRLGLALLPTLTRRDITADAFKEYTFTLRIFVNALAARWTLLPWSELRNYQADDADQAARAVIKALRHELDER